ncbi:MAG: VacJ family lipoprotein [Myxococcota bacterium]|nr:VacJ family lipoprotein [Myxococcota bacterium]
MNEAKKIPMWLALAALLLPACAGTGTPEPQDPWRGTNQGMFAVNNGVDDYVLGPVARGWGFVAPDLVEKGVSNFFANLDMPMIFANNLLQGDFSGALDDLNRFLVNTTVGIAGLIDVASDIGIDKNDEDFGQTLGVWGVGTGPYLQLPLLGPSTVRDTVALPVDFLSRPHTWFLPLAATASMGAVDAVNTRHEFDDEIREAKETSIDYYIFVREAYLQNRERRVRDGVSLPNEDIYDLDYDLDDEEE